MLKCTRIQTSAELLEDYSHQVEPPLVSDLSDRFVAVQRHAQLNRSDLLSVSPKNELVLFSADPHQHSVWTELRSAVPGAPEGETIRKLLAFHQRDALHALVHYPHKDGESDKVIVTERATGGDWTSPPLDAETANLIGQTAQMESYSDASGHLLIYGVSTSFDDPFVFISTYRPKAGWVHLWQERRTTVGSFSIIPGRKPGQVKVLEIFGDSVKLKGARISAKTFEWSAGEEVELALPTVAAKVFPFASDRLKNSFLVQSDEGGLYVVSQYQSSSPKIVNLIGSGAGPEAVASAQVGTDHGGRTIVFATERDTHELWILRQATSGDSPFDPWVPLGNAVAAIACPDVMADAAEVYTATIDGRVQNLSQDHVEALWSQATLETPKPVTDGVNEETTYKWHVRSLDDGGLPVKNTVVTVKSSASVEVLGNGLAAVADRNHEATFQTDGTGTLMLTAKASTLSTPELYVRVPDFMKADQFETLWADDRLHERLAGRDPNFPVDAAALKQHGVVPDAMKSDDAANVAKSLVACGQFMQEKRHEQRTGEFRMDRIDHEGWRLELAEDGGVTFVSLDASEIEREEKQLRDAGLFAPETLGAANLWGDFVHWIVNAAKKVFHIAALIKDGILYVTVNFAEGVRKFVLKTVAQAGKVLDAIFAGLKAAWKATEDFFAKAIQWLRMLFDWSDIQRTSHFVETQFAQTLQNVAGTLESARAPIEAFFDSVERSVEQQFDHLESLVSKGITLSELFGASSTATNGAAGIKGPSRNLLDDTYSKAHDENSVQSGFLSSKIPPDGSGVKVDDSFLQGAEAQAVLEGFDDLAKKLEAAVDLDRLKKSVAKIQKAMNEIHDAASFVQASLIALLEVMKDAILIVLEAVKVVLSALFDWAAKSLVAVVDLLRAPIYVPVLTEILKSKGIELSVLGLYSIAIGFPVTVLYKLMHGRAPITAGPDSVEALPQGLLPDLYLFRAIAYGAKYAGAYASDPFEPAKFNVNFPSYVEITTSVVTTGLEHWPDSKPSPGRHGTSTGLVGLSVALAVGYWLFMKQEKMKPDKALALDLMISQIEGFIELVAAIIYTVETYQSEEINSDSQARMAKSYLTSFPDLLWSGAMAKEPDTSAIVGTIAVASYLGATIASSFVEV